MINAVPVSGSSANAAAANNVSLAAAAGKVNHVSGIAVMGGGATAGSQINVVLSGLACGNLMFSYAVPAGAAVAGPQMFAYFDPPLSASGANVAISLAVPSFGAGNTGASAAIWGFQE